MRKLIFMVIALAMTNLATSQTASPELVSASGGSFTNDTYQLDWSVGEPVTATYIAGDFTLTQGFHQGNYIITTVEDVFPDMQISVFPNPTSDMLSLNFVKVPNFDKVSCMLTDQNGKILQQMQMTSDTEQLDFSAYANGLYFIRLYQNNQFIKSFKIIKNK